MATNRAQRDDNELDRLVRRFVSLARPRIQRLLGTDFPDTELRGVLQGIPTAEQRAGAVRNYVERIVADELDQLMRLLVLHQVQPPAAVLEAARTALPGSSTTIGEWQVIRGAANAGLYAGRVLLLLPESVTNPTHAPVAEAPTLDVVDLELDGVIDVEELHRNIDVYTGELPISSLTQDYASPAPLAASTSAPPTGNVLQQPYAPPTAMLNPLAAAPSNLVALAYPSQLASLTQSQGILASPVADGHSNGTTQPVYTGHIGYQPQAVFGTQPYGDAPTPLIGGGSGVENGEAEGSGGHKPNDQLAMPKPTYHRKYMRSRLGLGDGTILGSSAQGQNVPQRLDLGTLPAPHLLGPVSALAGSINPSYATNGAFTATPTSDGLLTGMSSSSDPSAARMPTPLYPNPTPLQFPVPSASTLQPSYSAPPTQTTFWAPIPPPPMPFPNPAPTSGRQTPVSAPPGGGATPTPSHVFGPNVPVVRRQGTRTSLLQLEGFGPATRTFSQASQGDPQCAQSDAERRAKQQRLG